MLVYWRKTNNGRKALATEFREAEVSLQVPKAAKQRE